MPLSPRLITRYLLSGLVLSLIFIVAFRSNIVTRFRRELPEVKQKGESILWQELETLRQQGESSTQQLQPGSQYDFKPGSSATGQNYTRRVIVGKTKKENLSWLDDEVLDVSKAIYEVDNRHAPQQPPKNKGNEVMVYLSYIIDHYDTLADVNIFIHAHRWTWHNNDLMDSDSAQMIRHLRHERVLREGYMNLRCQWYPGCPAWLHPGAQVEDEEKKEEKHVAKAWSEIFPGKPMPEVLAQPCCSQFAVSGDRLRAIPLTEYERLRQWVLNTKLGNNMSGRVFEYVWQYLFTGQHVLCPAIHTCYCDGYGFCFESEDAFQGWFKKRFELRQDEWELQSWLENQGKYVELVKKGRLKEAARVERAPEGRVELLKVVNAQRWIELHERKEQALAYGQDPLVRANSASREEP